MLLLHEISRHTDVLMLPQHEFMLHIINVNDVTMN